MVHNGTGTDEERGTGKEEREILDVVPEYQNKPAGERHEEDIGDQGSGEVVKKTANAGDPYVFDEFSELDDSMKDPDFQLPKKPRRL